ncbi:hypothetical protein GCM10020000_57680 [Streptomyces olivoverticillatus]
MYAPPGGIYGPESSCAVIGAPGATADISWESADSDTDPAVCVQAFSPQDNKWHLLGCGTSGRAAIPWGDNVASLRIRAGSAGTGTFVNWTSP